LLIISTLIAQRPPAQKAEIQAILDGLGTTISAAQTSGDTAPLEKQAGELAADYQFDPAGHEG